MHVLTEKQASWHKSYHLEFPQFVCKLCKARTNKKESGLINEKKRKQASPGFKKQHSLSSRKSEAQVVQDCTS